MPSIGIHAWATYLLVVVTIFAFASDRIRGEITALGILVALVLLFELYPLAPQAGAERIDTGRLLAGFANPALIAVLALLVLGQGLSRTGALD